MSVVEFEGKQYTDIDTDAQRVLGSVGVYTFRFFPQDGVWMASDYSARHFGISKFYHVQNDIDVNKGPQMIAEADSQRDSDLYKRVINGEERVSDTFRAADNTGYYRITLAVLEKNEKGQVTVVSGVLENVTELKHQNEMLQMLSDDYFSVYAVDMEKDVVFYTHRIKNITNKDYRSEMSKKPQYSRIIASYVKNEVVEEEQVQMREVTSIENVRKQLAKKNAYMHDYRVLRPNGKCEFVRIKFVKASASEDLSNVIVGFADVSKEHFEEWEHLAFYDQITGGYNYNYYLQQLKMATNEGYIVSMDIRDFKVVNSVCGMAMGDRVLAESSSIVDHAVDGLGFYGHVNADHFVFYLDTEDEKLVIDVIEKITEEFRKLVAENDIPKISPYFGITRWAPGDRSAVMFSEANAAKHRIKEQLETNFAFYKEGDNDQAIENKAIEDAFEGAIAKNQFEIWFQPKYTPVSRELTGAEALVRWRLSDGSLVPPGKFIPVYEKNGMIRLLDEYVFKMVLAQQRKWLDELGATVPISINLSRASLYHTTIVEEYKQLASEAGIDTGLLPMEITETAAINNTEIKTLADRFYEAGFPLHIDDFGTGYSSLSTLNMMRFDTLKLDKSLIDYIGEKNGNSLIKHTVALAKDLGLHVTAEGVENEDQIQFLYSVDCDNIQGFFYSKPLTVEEFTHRLETEVLSSRYVYRKAQ